MRFITAGLSFLLALPPAGSAQPVAALRLPTAVTLPVLQSLLQHFVDEAYGKAFARLGDESDFDHGHLLLDPAGRPLAVLFHTQELTCVQPRKPGSLDPAARNWIEWIDTRKVEDARKYMRRSYPSSASWDWFRLQRLPLLESHHTILDKMLDPDLLGASIAESRQWVFTKRPCADGGDPTLQVILPTKEKVCLALSSY